MTDPRSIHHRRRWYYVLWVTLLALSLGALHLWRTPVPMGDWTVRLKVQMGGAPKPVQVRLWFGPERLVHQKSLDAAWDVRTETLPQGVPGTLKDLRVPLHRRRWTSHPFPGLHGEVLVLVFSQEGQAARYLAIPLKEDLWAMMVRHKRVTSLDIVTQWSSLPLEPAL